jgi:hypothetical protein
MTLAYSVLERSDSCGRGTKTIVGTRITPGMPAMEEHKPSAWVTDTLVASWASRSAPAAVQQTPERKRIHPLLLEKQVVRPANTRDAIVPYQASLRDRNSSVHRPGMRLNVGALSLVVLPQRPPQRSPSQQSMSHKSCCTFRFLDVMGSGKRVPCQRVSNRSVTIPTSQWPVFKRRISRQRALLQIGDRITSQTCSRRGHSSARTNRHSSVRTLAS